MKLTKLEISTLYGLTDYGWMAGLWSALAMSLHWFLDPGYRSKPEKQVSWSLLWTWRTGWHLGRWSPR